MVVVVTPPATSVGIGVTSVATLPIEVHAKSSKMSEAGK